MKESIKAPNPDLAPHPRPSWCKTQRDLPRVMMDTSASHQPVSETQLEIADGIAVTEKGMEGFVCTE